MAFDDRTAEFIATSTWYSPAADRSAGEFLIKRPEDRNINDIVHAAQGIMTDDFVIIQSLPINGLQVFERKLSNLGYFPEKVRPYRPSRGTNVAAIFRRMKGPSFTLQAWSIAEIKRQIVDAEESGSEVIDLAGVRQNDQNRFVAVVAKSGTTPLSEFLIGLDADSRTERHDAYREQNFQESTRQAFLDCDGEVRHNSIWMPAGRSGERSMHYGRRDDLLARKSRPIFDVSVVIESDGDVKFTYCHEKEADYESEVVIENDLHTHLERITELTEQGYSPTAIGLDYNPASDTYHAVSCWRTGDSNRVVASE